MIDLIIIILLALGNTIAMMAGILLMMSLVVHGLVWLYRKVI